VGETECGGASFDLWKERQMERVFTDRHDAGRRLAVAVAALRLAEPVILALPRGGVPVAHEVAKALRAPLDLLIVRKIGAPGHAEYGIGAVVDGDEPQVLLNDEAAVSQDYLAAETRRQLAEIERRRVAYLGNRPPIPLSGRNVVVVDDGIATGGTVRAALRALRKTGAKSITLAVPVAPADAIASLREEADALICLATPDPFYAVSQHYADFEQISDEEVVRLLSPENRP
jgi:putative phosphoribosyl transferase